MAKAPAAPTRRRNYGRNHGYFLDGRELKGRGVTTIIGQGFPKNALQYWAAKEVATAAVDERDIWEPLLRRARNAAWEYLKEAPFRDRDAAAHRGQEVHRYAERLQAGEQVEVPDELVGHVDQYLRFREEWQPEDEIIEGVVVNRSQLYMGTFDSIATLPGFADACRRDPRCPFVPQGDRVLYDIKTSRSGVYPEVALQLAAYRYAESYLPDPKGGEELPMPVVDGCAVLHVTGEDYQLVPVNAGERAFRAFLYVAQTAAFIGTYKEPGWGSELLSEPIQPLFEGSNA